MSGDILAQLTTWTKKPIWIPDVYHTLFAVLPLSQNVCLTMFLTYCRTEYWSCNTWLQCLSHTLQHRLHDKHGEQGTITDPTSSLSFAALASASTFCFSASAWCLFLLLFLECTELAALLVVSRTLWEKLAKISWVMTLKAKIPSLPQDCFACSLLWESQVWSAHIIYQFRVISLDQYM